MKHENLSSIIMLVINSATRQNTELALIEGNSLILHQKYPENAQELPRIIELFLEKTDRNLLDLDLLGVVCQGESLTGIRIAVATANTIARHLEIPIVKLTFNSTEEAIKCLQDGSFQAEKQILNSL